MKNNKTLNTTHRISTLLFTFKNKKRQKEKSIHYMKMRDTYLHWYKWNTGQWFPLGSRLTGVEFSWIHLSFLILLCHYKKIYIYIYLNMWKWLWNWEIGRLKRILRYMLDIWTYWWGVRWKWRTCYWTLEKRWFLI